MIIKSFEISFLIGFLLVSVCSCCNRSTEKGDASVYEEEKNVIVESRRIAYDRIYKDSKLIPFCRVITLSDSTKYMEWYTNKRDTIMIPNFNDVVFQGGIKAMEKFANKIYYSSIDEWGEDNICGRKYIHVLLDSSLCLVEARVRAYPMAAYENEDSMDIKMDSVFLRIGYLSQGHWKLSEPYKSGRGRFHHGLIFNWFW